MKKRTLVLVLLLALGTVVSVAGFVIASGAGQRWATSIIFAGVFLVCLAALSLLGRVFPSVVG